MLKLVQYHSKKNKCRTYFSVQGDFDPNEISSILQLTPSETMRKGDKKKMGKGFYTNSTWIYGDNEDYDADTEIMLSKTLEGLWNKKELLIQIKKTFDDVEFVLMVVPVVRYDESTPTLAPTLEIMKWCVDTGTDMVIDLYVSAPDDCDSDITLEL